MLAHPIAKCSKTLAANTSVAPLDVVKMKSVLKALGHYKAPEWGVSQYPDPALFAAIEKFQRAQGLKPDGIVKPDGATEAALSRALTPRRATTALQNTAQALQAMGRGGDELLAHITREEAALLSSVTDGATINPQTGLLEFFWGGSDRDDDGNGYDNDAQHGETNASAAEASDAQAAENDQQGRDDTRDNDGGDRVLNPQARGGGELTQKSENPSAANVTQTVKDEEGRKTRTRQGHTVIAQTKDESLSGHLLDTNEEEDLDAQNGYTNPTTANDDQAVENDNQYNAFDSAGRGDTAGYGDMTAVDAVNKARSERRSTTHQGNSSQQSSSPKDTRQNFLDFQAKQAAAQAAKAMALRLGVDLTNRAAYDPRAQTALSRALSFREQDRVTQSKTLESITELSNTYEEFGPGGVFGELATSISDNQKTPSQMTDDELESGIKDAEDFADKLDNIAIVAPNKLAAASFSSTAQFYKDGANRMRNELAQRQQSN